jgi:N-acetylglucosaminyldiphosphoundecaprenol N-acetyl-beta-D-mannosaminyltransferase
MNSSADSIGPTIFGVRLDQLPDERGVRVACAALLASSTTHTVFTPNPEILLYARTHPDYAALLNQGDLVLPDGFGIVLVEALRRRGPVTRWAGIDVAALIVELTAAAGARVMFLGGQGRTGERAADRWRQRLPGIDVVAAGDGMVFGEYGAAAAFEEESRVDALIDRLRPAVILVALGHPKQERWIIRHKTSVPSARIMMGVGGAFDVWAGRFPRAPRRLRAFGLEWAWRLWQDPVRLPRVLRATVEFPIRALSERTDGRRAS